MAVSVSLINMKGGVGKTTIASQLAHFAADDGLRVLAVDLDPQSNLSREVRAHAREYKWHVFDYQIPYSRSYATASRAALSLSITPYTWYDRIEGFSGLKDEILAAVGFQGGDI